MNPPNSQSPIQHTPRPTHTNLLQQVLDRILSGNQIDLLSQYPSTIDEIKQTGRYYHNACHIFDCIGFLWSHKDQLLPTTTSELTAKSPILEKYIRGEADLDLRKQRQFQDLLTITLALYYHDVIYDPKAHDNEEKSAVHAEQTLGELLVRVGEEVGNQDSLAEEPQPTPYLLWNGSLSESNLIYDLIMATKRHQIPEDWLRMAGEGDSCGVGQSSNPQNTRNTQNETALGTFSPNPPSHSTPLSESKVVIDKDGSQWKSVREGSVSTQMEAIRAVVLCSALLDTDLSILSVSPARFEVYDKQIRQEYQHYPLCDYGPGRGAVMKKFAERGQGLFFTPWAKSALLPTALENLALLIPERYQPENGWDDAGVIGSFWDFYEEAEHFETLCRIFTDEILTALPQ